MAKIPRESGMQRTLDPVGAVDDGSSPRGRPVEEELQEKNRYLEAIFGRAGMGITVLGPDRRIIEANEAMERMLGYARGELVGKSVPEISHPEDEPGNLLMYQDMMEGRLDRFQIEKRYFRKDGSIMEALLHVTYIPGPDGKPRYLVGMLEDITASKQVAEDLRRNIALSAAIRDAQALFISGADHTRIFESLLDILVRMTESQFGFLDDVLKDPDGTLYKKNLAMSSIAWDEGSRDIYQALRTRNLEFRNLNNLSGAPVTEGSLVISNDPASDPRSGALPKGHPPLKNFMGLPLWYGGEVIGVAGVANRPGGYDASVAHFVEPLVSTCASIIAAIRSEEVQKGLNTQVRESLREKEILLKEIHHRVKNNLQIVSSLINLQARELEASPAYGPFMDTRNRIRAMAMIHERLYQSGDFSAVDMKAFIGEFAGSVFRSQEPGQGRIALRPEVDDLTLGVDDAIPCTLIINELLTNAIKHAFPGSRGGEIFLGIRNLAEGWVEVEVRDNGVGFPDHFDPGSSHTLGMELVRGLVRQLGGTLEAAGRDGAAFSVRFTPKGNAPEFQ